MCKPKRHFSRLLLALLPAWAIPVHAQAVLYGRVASADGEAIAFASVGVSGSTAGAHAGEDGAYRIEGFAAGQYTVIASALGFRSEKEQVTLRDGEVRQLDFVLTEEAIYHEGVVVTGTMRETHVSDSPVKVEVISGRYLEKVLTTNVMDVIGNVNGLYQQIDCGVCYTNNIRINGMEGPYTAVLIDGMPVMSSLATVYGLNGINPSLIQQIEIVKGPVSTLYGTEAMAGVINVITKRPEHAPRVTLNAFGTSDGELNADFAATPLKSRRGFSMLASGTVSYMDRFVDENGDGFSDVPLTRRVSLFSRSSVTGPNDARMLDVSAKLYYEDRFGGVRGWTRSDRGSGEVYGEFVVTNRAEVVGSYRPAFAGRSLRLDFAANAHHQDSFYGATSYRAQQQVFAANLIWNRAVSGRRDLLLGAALRYNGYDDNTPATGRAERRLIPGLFAQYEHVLSPALRVLAGARVDHHAAHGLIFSPRLSTKLRATENTTLRLNAGTGFRVVSVFTEDHAALTGSRRIVIAEALRPERSYSITASLQHILPFGADPLTVDVDGFFTRFTNQILPDYEAGPDVIVYANLSGSAVSRGVSVSLNQGFTSVPLSYTIGATVMDVARRQEGMRERITFAPAYQGVANATYRIPARHLTLDYTANLTGPMRLPRYEPPFERAVRSRPFILHNVQLTREITLGAHELGVYASVENILDFTQESPLIDPANPFGEHFDTAYVYGPIHGRCIGIGARFSIP